MLVRLLTFPFRYIFTRIKKSIGKLDVLMVQPLYAFGNEQEVRVQGRVIELYRQSRPSGDKSVLQNLLAAIRRYAGNSVPGVLVDIDFQGQQITVKSDVDGIVRGNFQRKKEWKREKDFVIFQLREEEGVIPDKKQQQIPVFCFLSTHSMGMISDIDDTILISHATKIGKKFWLSIAKNAYTRRPLPGISRLYKTFYNGGENPVFYVSSSDWNLYDMMQDFIRYRDLPQGSLLMHDLSINLKNFWKSGGGSHQHKLEKIEMLFSFYSGMKFVLVGDSGQKDPELYAEIIKKYPERVLAVYIREIKKDEAREKKLKEAVETSETLINIAFVKSAAEALAHARKKGVIGKML